VGPSAVLGQSAGVHSAVAGRSRAARTEHDGMTAWKTERDDGVLYGNEAERGDATERAVAEWSGAAAGRNRVTRANRDRAGQEWV
jgi:hypothetical protein